MEIVFLPENRSIIVDNGAKILAVARQAGIEIRFGCASCRCGTCAVAIVEGEASAMDANEKALLTTMKLATDGSIRLSCQARTASSNARLVVDLGFQKKYSPDQGLLK